jgi:hypothetical protein
MRRVKFISDLKLESVSRNDCSSGGWRTPTASWWSGDACDGGEDGDVAMNGPWISLIPYETYRENISVVTNFSVIDYSV